jgi:hypothetical protein
VIPRKPETIEFHLDTLLEECQKEYSEYYPSESEDFWGVCQKQENTTETTFDTDQLTYSLAESEGF